MKKHTRRDFLMFSAYALIATSCTSLKTTRHKISDENSTHPATAFRTEEVISINKPRNRVFSFVTNLHNANKISEHLASIIIIDNNNVQVGAEYSRILQIHGFSNKQTVVVTQYKQDHIYATQTALFGITVNHTYQFVVKDDTTQITLTKEVPSWENKHFLLMPFIKHQLTRPEHDGQHLTTLKKAVESTSA